MEKSHPLEVVYKGGVLFDWHCIFQYNGSQHETVYVQFPP